jgi:PAS domain S-box-containing protein
VTSDPVRVLLVEDEPGHAELARRAFEGRPGAFEVSVAETVDAARTALHGTTPPDLVIADWLLPDGEGLDLLRSEPVRAMPPIVIMTSHGSERVAVEAMRAGAVDYVVKSEIALADLPHMAERAVRQRKIEQALGDLVAGTAAAGGEALFGELVLRLARALRVKYASVAEVVANGRVRTLARSVDGRLAPPIEYDLAGTPCAGVLDGSVCHVRDGVAERYPADEGLRRMGAQSYVGVVLRASTGDVLGLVNAIHDGPLDEVVRPEGVLQVFAARAAAEIERRRLETDLRRAAFEWREAFDGLPLGVVVVDAQGRILRVNRTAVEHSGRAGWTELIDTPLETLGPGEPWAALGELSAALREGERPVAREVNDPLTRHTFMVSARDLAANGEGGGRAVLNFQDVTETVQLKEQLRQSETMAEIGSIVAGVAHEVRNPLFSISATLDAFESRFRNIEGHERYLSVLRGEIVRLTGLMSDLLDFGRPSRPDFSECSVEDVIEAAVSACGPLARRKAVEIVWPRRTPVPPVLVDRARVSQVLQNLIENAVHFSPPGGRVEVALGEKRERDECFVECAVKDSGPGFDPADLPRLFEPFFTRRRGGTGLGLSIVKRIVYDHGGEVSAENHVDGGAVVTVRLRAVRP